MTLLGKITAALCRQACDQRGASSVEYALLIALVGVPTYVIVFGGWIIGWTSFPGLLPLLSEHYRMVVFVETLPMP